MKVAADVSRLTAGVKAAAEAIRQGCLTGVYRAALQAEREAKNNLKGDERGKHLMTSIHSDVREEDGKAVGVVGCGAATDVEGDAGELFGIYVHEGTGILSRTGMGRKDVPWSYTDAEGKWHTTSGMKANPFLENAFLSERERMEKIVRDEVRKWLKG